MNLVTHDDDIKWFNASLLRTLNEYGVLLPEVQAHTKLAAPTDMLDTVISSIANDNGSTYNGYVQAALACLDTSQGCWICHDRSQSRYDWCASGCQVCNNCQGCDTDDDPFTCSMCDDTCIGCNTDCDSCDNNCIGTQTCISCNAGETCLTGCFKGHQPGCEQCHTPEYNNCAVDYYPGCGRAESVRECLSGCNTTCVSNNENPCSATYALTTCNLVCQSNNTPGYIHGCNGNDTPCTNKFVNDGSCNINYTQSPYDSSCGLSQLESQCYQGFQSRVCSTADGCLSMCVSHVTPSNCKSSYRNCSTLTNGVVSCTSAYITCGYDEGINCQGVFKNQNGSGSTSCEGGYKTAPVQTPVGHTYTDESCTHGYTASNGSSCASGYSNIYPGGLYCVSQYRDTQFGVYCESNYGTEGGGHCVSNYSCGVGNSCAEGYYSNPCIETFSGEPFSCKRGYTSCYTWYSAQCANEYQLCFNDYNNSVTTCTSCNTGRDNICTLCVGGQPANCPTCFGSGDSANCTGGCVTYQADTCDECVSGGHEGCNTCQGCDAGCNTEVTCSRYGNGWCYASFSDTSCGHVVNNCSRNYNTSGPACRSCNTCQGCQGTCDTSCQNCQGASCQTCQSFCESTCQGCDTSCQTCQTTCESSCEDCQGASCQTCQGCNVNCYDCDGNCEAGCQGTCNAASH